MVASIQNTKTEECLRAHLASTPLTKLADGECQVFEDVVSAFKDLWSGAVELDVKFARRCWLSHEIFVKLYFADFL